MFTMWYTEHQGMCQTIWFLDQEQGRIFQSSGRKLFIQSHTNNTNYGFGFLMNYVAVPKRGACELFDGLVQISCDELWCHPSIVDIPCALTIPPSDGCDGGLKVISRESGVLTSPGYPSNYRRNLNCLYEIDVSSKSSVWTVLPCTVLQYFSILLLNVSLTEFGDELSLNVVDLDLEYRSDCQYDWVKLYDPYNAAVTGE